MPKAVSTRPVPIYVWVPPAYSALYKIEVVRSSGALDDITDYILSGNLTDGATDTIGNFQFEIDNSSENYTNVWTGNEVLNFYCDYETTATTKRFRGRIEKISYKQNTVVITGRSESLSLLDVTVTKSYEAIETSAILLDLFSTYASGFTTSNVSASSTSITINWYQKPFIECVQELCRQAEFDFYIDSSLDAHYFAKNSVNNQTEAVVYDANLLEIGDFAYDRSLIKNRIIVYGADIGSLPLIYTKDDSASQIEIKELIIKDQNITTMEQAQERAEYELALSKDPPLVGDVTSIGLATLQPGERVRISSPYNNLQPSYYRVISFKHEFGDLYSTTLTIEKEPRKIFHLMKDRISNEQKRSDLPNPNEMRFSWNFDFNTDTGTHSNTEIVNGKLQIIGGGGGADPTNHADLQNLTYATSGHTGFQASGSYETANANIQIHVTGSGSPHTAAGVGADASGTASAGDSAHLSAFTHSDIALNTSARHTREHTMASASDHTDWPAGLDVTELSYVNGVTSAIQTQLDGKQASGTYVTSVTGTSPVASSGGTTPAISIPAATSAVNGYATSTQITKLDGIATGAQVNNISDANATDLTDAGATTLHKHDHGGMDGLTDDDHTQYVLRQSAANVVINDTGGDFDFRIEGDTDANLLCLDAGTDKVGIGTIAPTAKLHIKKAATNPSVDSFKLEETTTGDTGYITMGAGGSTTSGFYPFVYLVGAGSTPWGGLFEGALPVAQDAIANAGFVFRGGRVGFANLAAADAIRFQKSDGTNLMVISYDGRIGMGMASAGGVRLAVQGTGTTTGYGYYHQSSAGTANFYTQDDGVGYLRAAAWTYGSDRKLKENIVYLGTETKEIERIMQLKPAKFDYIDGVKNSLGFIAQDVQLIYPDLITNIAPDKSKEPTLGMKTTELIPYMIKAMQEQQIIIKDLIKRIEILEAVK